MASGARLGPPPSRAFGTFNHQVEARARELISEAELRGRRRHEARLAAAHTQALQVARMPKAASHDAGWRRLRDGESVYITESGKRLTGRVAHAAAKRQK